MYYFLNIEICNTEKDIGPCRGIYKRYAYNKMQNNCELFTYGGCRGNRNNFLTYEECMQSCQYLNGAAGGGDSNIDYILTTTSRTLNINNDNNNNYQEGNNDDQDLNIVNRNNLKIDCEVTHWTDWSPCSVSCGTGLSEKFRRITQHPRNGGTLCPKRLIKRKRCNGPTCEN